MNLLKDPVYSPTARDNVNEKIMLFQSMFLYKQMWLNLGESYIVVTSFTTELF